MLAVLLRLSACLLACACACLCVRLAWTRIKLVAQPQRAVSIEDILRDPTLSFLVFCGAGIVISYATSLGLLVPCIVLAYVLSRRAPTMLDARRARELRSACDEQVDVMADIVAMGVRACPSMRRSTCTAPNSITRSLVTCARHNSNGRADWLRARRP